MNPKVSECLTIKIAQQRSQQYLDFHGPNVPPKRASTERWTGRFSRKQRYRGSVPGRRLQTHEVSGLKARATPATNKLAPNRYMGHSHPSGSGFSPGLTPQSQPEGGSNCDSLPWPPCRRDVMERLRAAASGLRAHRTARSGATVCRRRAIWGGMLERRSVVLCGLL